MLHHQHNVAKERQLLHADFFFTVGYLFSKELLFFLWGDALL